MIHIEEALSKVYLAYAISQSKAELKTCRALLQEALRSFHTLGASYDHSYAAKLLSEMR